MSASLMGDGVNVAARLEGTNKVFGTTICISDTVFDEDRKREFMIYELVGIRASDDPELKPPDDAPRQCELTREASSYFEQGEVDEAARRYGDILRAFPDDPVARSLLATCSAKVPI